MRLPGPPLPESMPHAYSRPALATLVLASLCSSVAFAQANAGSKTTPAQFDADSARLAELPWRSIGPAVTSGRVVDFAVPEGPKSQIGERLGELFYVASASGGVWKSTNGGTIWESVFDHQGSASIGDIAVAAARASAVHLRGWWAWQRNLEEHRWRGYVDQTY